MSKTPKSNIPPLPIDRQIHLIRGQKIMLDSDLAELYGVPTYRLNEAVKRNAQRFPGTFMFRLTREEASLMRSQFAISSKRKIQYQPLAFTEHGVVMLSSVLNSPRAIQMSIMVVEAFVRMRELIVANKDFAARLEKLETSQQQTASVIEILVEEINHMKHLPSPPKRRIGFDL